MFIPHETAHLIIDVQAQYCTPNSYGSMEYHNAAKKIRDFVSKIRDLGILNCWIYSDDDKEGYKKAKGGFYLVEPDKEKDLIIPKVRSFSAFQGSSINKILKEKSIKTLIISGFYMTECVHDTAVDAKKSDCMETGYSVFLLRDLTSPDIRLTQGFIDYKMKVLKEKGVLPITSQIVLSSFDKNRISMPLKYSPNFK